MAFGGTGPTGMVSRGEHVVLGICRDVKHRETWVTLTDEAALGTPIGFSHHDIEHNERTLCGNKCRL
jgi:hypothetical protein